MSRHFSLTYNHEILYYNILEKSGKLKLLNTLQDGGVFLMYLVCIKGTV